MERAVPVFTGGGGRLRNTGKELEGGNKVLEIIPSNALLSVTPGSR